MIRPGETPESLFNTEYSSDVGDRVEGRTEHKRDIHLFLMCAPEIVSRETL